MTSRLLVVGGGIAGFGLARALSLRGMSGTLVERLSAPSAPGLGLNLPGNAVRALAALGVADEVVDRGVRIRRREYRNQAGRLLFAVDEEAFWGTVGPVDSACHNPNTPPPATPLVNGPTIRLPGHHAKVNRKGYIGHRRGGPAPATTNP